MRTPKLSQLVAVVACLLGIPQLTACGSGEETSARNAADPVKLEVSAPTDGATVRAPSVRVTGEVEPANATVTVEGSSVDVRDGRFETSVDLEPGDNLVAVDGSASARAHTHLALSVTRKRTAKEIAAARERERQHRIEERQRRIEQRERERQRELEREQRRQEEIAAATKSFAGNGSKNIGTVSVDAESILEWTNTADPSFRQILIYDDDFGISVSSSAASGDSVVPPGTYRNIHVDGGDSWTISIRPRG